MMFGDEELRFQNMMISRNQDRHLRTFLKEKNRKNEQFIKII